jgi:hypothetical protein
VLASCACVHIGVTVARIFEVVRRGYARSRPGCGRPAIEVTYLISYLVSISGSPARRPCRTDFLRREFSAHGSVREQQPKFGTKVPMKSGPKSLSTQFCTVTGQFCASPMGFLFVSRGRAVGKRVENAR